MKSVIITAGKYGQVYLAYLREAGVDVAGFLDDDPAAQGEVFDGVPVLGPISLLPSLRETRGVEAVYCPLGNARLRVKFLLQARQLGYLTPNYIHPSVVIGPDTALGQGVYILQGANIMPFVTIEDFVMISMDANVAHHSVLRRGGFLSTGCNFGASIVADEYAYCGISSTIMTGVHSLGRDSLVGAGAVVIRDVPAGAVVAGVPAKVLKYKPEYAPNALNTSILPPPEMTDTREG